VDSAYPPGHNKRHKARCMTGGYLTNLNIKSVYPGVVSHCGIQLIVFLVELNGLNLWGAYVGNPYLEGTVKERVYILGGLACCLVA
jgi:hypothetical protein